jgi:MFS family permease
MATTDPKDHDGGPQNLATALAEVSERASVLIREEIELAKAEVSEKATKLLRGTVVALAAGIFVVTALFFVLIGLALLLYYELPVNPYAYFWGFFAMALILLVLGAIAGFLAARAVKAGSPPVPKMAIDEARKIRETLATPSSSTSETKGEVDASALSRRDS